MSRNDPNEAVDYLKLIFKGNRILFLLLAPRDVFTSFLPYQYLLFEEDLVSVFCN